MQKTGLRAVAWIALASLGLFAGCTGESKPSASPIDAIAFKTTTIPPAGAGELYDVVITFTTVGKAAPPDRFELLSGELPEGVSLVPDREDRNGDGIPDVDGALTGNARLVGYPRQARPTLPYNFVIKAISTGLLSGARDPNAAALAAEQPYKMTVGEGRIAILNPTAQQGTTDPAVPAFPDVINFVNPANPQAFFSFAFQTAGGSGNTNLQIYVPRELELSVFDKLAVGNEDDTNEAPGSGSKYRVDFSDGGVFNLQAGNTKVQIGGFQSPRGVVGTITNLDSDWFQNSPGAGGPPLNSRRSFGDVEGLAAGDPTLGTAQPILFSDYFSPSFLPTWGEDSDPAVRRKYPFISTEYHNAFFLAFDAALHQTPLRFNAIVEAIDNRGTVTRNDDVIARKSYAVQVRIPEIKFDTVLLPAGRVGVDYREFINGSGGVPPLSYDLEWVDGTDDAKITSPDNLDKAAFGINIDPKTGGFFGVPKASGSVDLSVRIYADVMNPSQSGTSQVPTGGTDTQGRPNEWNGTHAVTGKVGIHKTIRVTFATPSLPVLANSSLPAGIDGTAYRTSGGGTVKLTGGGGVPTLFPDPVTHQGIYPANPTRAYGWSSLYTLDKSHGANEGDVVPGLPNALTLDGEPLSSTNGQITGTAFDRGFHPVTIQQIDFYIGPATAPNLLVHRQTQNTSLTLSISPDNALYLRGLQSDEGKGGEETGLLHSTTQLKEQRMVPMFLESALFQTNTGEAPKFFSAMPAGVDILPVAIPHGDSKVHTDRNEAVVSGYWPAEAGKEEDWYYYQNRAWKDTQQEMTWIQLPNKQQSRVMLWGETRITSYLTDNPTGAQSNAAYPGGWEQMYQQYLETGDRGVLIVNPGTGEYWMPARLDNASSSHGWTFGSEWTQGRIAMSSYEGGYYGAYYYYSESPYHVWGAHSYGLGAYLENHGTSTNSTNGWVQNGIGRTATSVAVSTDGLWCATAMAGGDAQKILLWRTDGASIDGAIIGQTYVTGLDGADKNGDPIPNSAAIVNLPGSNSSNADDLLPDSLKFVNGGLVFLRYTTTSTTAYALDQIFGLNLIDGSLTSRNLNTAVGVSSDQNPGKANLVVSSRAFFIPDQDQGYGNIMQPNIAAQFAFTSNKAAPGSTGPTALAFVAGDNEYLARNANNNKFPRSGFQQVGERAKSVFFLQINPDATTAGLDLGSANTVLTDLTGADKRVYGEFLTPGRRGEGSDWLKMSDDGKYVAAVRDWHQDSTTSTSYGRDTFGSSYYYYYTSSGLFQYSSDDLLVMSTPIAHAAGEIDMDKDKSGQQHVLFIGTSTGNTSGTAGSTPAMPSYASARNLINGNTRKVSGLEFSQDSTALFFEYTGDSWTMSKHSGYAYGWGFNPGSIGTSTTYYNNIGLQLAIRFNFRDPSTGGPIDINDSKPTNLAVNLMDGMTGVGMVGDVTPPFTVTRDPNFTSGGSRETDQVFHVKFRSANGDFQYYVSDRMDSASHMFGVNMTANDIESPEGKTRKPYEAFKAHGAGVSFEQMEYKGFLYGNRVAAAPSGTTLETTGRDGSGIVFLIGSDAASSGSATNLEIYALNANLGGECVALTSAATTGASNAINYMYPSMDGNTIVAQRSDASNSRDSRTELTSRNDIIAVTNVHNVLYKGASPVAFTVSKDASHGSTVAFVGDGTPAGAVALVYSWSDGTGNQSWAERTLYIGLLAPGAGRAPLDTTESHYTILSGGRKLDDNPNNSD